MKERLKLPGSLEGAVWAHRNSGQSTHRHHHDELELNLVTAGSGVYLLDDRRYELGRQSLVWLFPRQEHVLLHQSPDFAMWIVVFKPALIDHVAQDPTDRLLRQANPPGHYCRRLPAAISTSLGALCAAVAATTASPALYDAGLAYLLLRAWSDYRTAQDIPAGTDVHPAVERAALLLSSGEATDSLAALATKAGLSPSRLSRLFRRQTGVALAEFRNRQRVERFRALYGSGQRLTMLTAALAAGFGSYAQFHRVFRRLMGCSPSAYRRTL